MEAQLTNDNLKMAATILSKVAADGELKFDDKGLTASFVDDSKSMYIELRLPVEFFTMFKCEKEVTAPINFTLLAEFMERQMATDTVFITKKPDENYLIITLKNDKTKLQRELRIPFLEEVTETNKSPELQSAVSLDISSNMLKMVIKDLKSISADVMLAISDKPRRFFVSATTEKSNKDYKFVFDETPVLTDQTITSKYSRTFFEKMMAGLIAKNVNIQFDTDFPVSIKIKSDSGLEVRYMLAPQVEEDQIETAKTEDFEFVDTGPAKKPKVKKESEVKEKDEKPKPKPKPKPVLPAEPKTEPKVEPKEQKTEQKVEPKEQKTEISEDDSDIYNTEYNESDDDEIADTIVEISENIDRDGKITD